MLFSADPEASSDPQPTTTLEDVTVEAVEEAVGRVCCQKIPEIIAPICDASRSEIHGRRPGPSGISESVSVTYACGPSTFSVAYAYPLKLAVW